MHRTILLALPALLFLAACADDTDTQPAEAPGTLAGQPVRFTATGLAITPAGVTQTKADTDFSTMTVYMTDTEGNTWQANYNNTNGTWQADDEPLYWPTSTDRYTFTAISPAGTDPHITLPAEWTEADLTTYEAIRAICEASTVTPSMSPVSLTLGPALTKVQVVSTSGQPVSLIDAPTAGTLNLTGGTAGNAATGIMTLHPADELTYEGYVLPAGTAGFGFLTDNVYTVDTELKAGTVVTTCDMVGSTAIVCPEPGKLTWPNTTSGTVVITGTLNGFDTKTISDNKDDIVNLYVMGGIEEGASLNMNRATRLKSVYLAEATLIDITFDGCTQLTSINLPQATSIGKYAFLGCGALSSICLPQAMSIGERAFYKCNVPGSIICLPMNATIDTEAFHSSSSWRPTLFLSDEDATLEDAQERSNWGGINWKYIYYGYQGTGDYLDERNYSGHWSSN